MEKAMKRYRILDEIRGVTICSMILYHTVWDLVYIFERNWSWFYSDLAYLWQQSICWCFIFLSGFCFSLGKKKIKRGLFILAAGILVTIVTCLITPSQRIFFGVLTLLGASMVIMFFGEKIWNMIPENNVFRKIPSIAAMAVSFFLFLLTKGINNGYLGIGDLYLWELPKELYQQGDLMTFIGFTREDFYSADYFSLMPWFFLFMTGYFLFHAVKEKGWLSKLSELPSVGHFWGFCGRTSLWIYLIHQPIIYGILCVLN